MIYATQCAIGWTVIVHPQSVLFAKSSHAKPKQGRITHCNTVHQSKGLFSWTWSLIKQQIILQFCYQGPLLLGSA